MNYWLIFNVKLHFLYLFLHIDLVVKSAPRKGLKKKNGRETDRQIIGNLIPQPFCCSCLIAPSLALVKKKSTAYSKTKLKLCQILSNALSQSWFPFASVSCAILKSVKFDQNNVSVSRIMSRIKCHLMDSKEATAPQSVLLNTLIISRKDL